MHSAQVREGGLMVHATSNLQVTNTKLTNCITKFCELPCSELLIICTMSTEVHTVLAEQPCSVHGSVTVYDLHRPTRIMICRFCKMK